MKYKSVRDRCCQNEKYQDHGKFGKGNIIRHSKYKTRQWRRRRYLCKTCDAGRISQKTTQLLGNLYGLGIPYLVVFHVFENSDQSREVFVVSGSVTTVA